jgi:hypothetical protein
MAKIDKQYNLVNTDKRPHPAVGIYIMGVFGTAVYFISNTDGFGNVVVAILKSLVWPAFLINRIFELLRI